MHTEVNESGRFERTLTVHLEESELEAAKNKAARELSKELKIKGFRPGKAPRAVVERMVGAERLRSDAIEEAIPGAVTAAIEEAGLDPVTVPRVSAIRDADAGGVDVDVRVTMWPELEAIPDFAGRKVVVERPEVSEEEVQQQLDALRNQFAELDTVGRPADDGDFVLVNVTVLKDGAEVADASANDLLYEVGSQSFLPGLDALLVGASSGDIREGEAVLPPGFTDAGGSEVVLRVLVKDVRAKRLPELTDDLVQDATEFDTVDELRRAIETNMLAYKVQQARRLFQDRMLESVVDDLDLVLPEDLVDSEVEARVHNLLHRLEEEKISFVDYLRITGQDQQAFLDSVREQSTHALSTRILLEGIAKIEGLSVGDDEYRAAIQSLSGQSDADLDGIITALSESGQEATLAGDILRRKALERLVEAGTAIDGDGEPVDLTPIVIEDEEDEEDDNDENEDASQEASGTDVASEDEPADVEDDSEE